MFIMLLYFLHALLFKSLVVNTLAFSKIKKCYPKGRVWKDSKLFMRLALNLQKTLAIPMQCGNSESTRNLFEIARNAKYETSKGREYFIISGSWTGFFYKQNGCIITQGSIQIYTFNWKGVESIATYQKYGNFFGSSDCVATLWTGFHCLFTSAQKLHINYEQ